jgi:predicted PurR-regulated permease PerM
MGPSIYVISLISIIVLIFVIYFIMMSYAYKKVNNLIADLNKLYYIEYKTGNNNKNNLLDLQNKMDEQTIKTYDNVNISDTLCIGQSCINKSYLQQMLSL